MSSQGNSLPVSGVSLAEPTPGPWYVEGAGIDAKVRGADMTLVAVRHRLPGAAHAANARLIAAAPSLLEAAETLRLILHLAALKYGFDLTGSAGMELADAAIAKALGPHLPQPIREDQP